MGKLLTIGDLMLAVLGYLPAGAALADTSAGASSAVSATPLFQGGSGGRAERAERLGSGFVLVTMPKAMPRDVDTDGDGWIGFDQLTRHEFPNDF